MENFMVSVGQKADWAYLFIALFSALALSAFVFCEIKKQGASKKRKGRKIKPGAKKRLYKKRLRRIATRIYERTRKATQEIKTKMHRPKA